MALISVIVPVYNVEKYLKQCINSILAQTYKELELILVDDGSTDHSGEICDRYASFDHRIRVFHQENQGVSDARNNALAVVRGQYVTFVDSDDYIAPDMLEVLYRHISKENARISICGIWLADENGLKKRQLDGIYLKMNSREAMEKMFSFGYYDLSAGAKLYQTDLFQEIRFPSDTVGEDMYVNPRLFRKADSVVYDSTPKYYYRQHGESITKHESFGDSYIKGMKACVEFVIKQYPELKDTVQCMELYVYLMIYTTLLRGKGSKSCLEEYRRIIMEKTRTLENPKVLRTFPSKGRISLWLLLHSRPLHAAVYRAYWGLSSKA